MCDGARNVMARSMRRRGEPSQTRLRSRPERVQREGDRAVGQGRPEAGSCDHRFEGRRCGVDLVDGAGEARGSPLCLPAPSLTSMAAQFPLGIVRTASISRPLESR